MKSKEIWRAVKGFEGLYEISNLGRVKSLDRRGSNGRIYKGKIKKNQLGKRGYYVSDLSHKGVRKNKKIHRMVAEAYVPNPKNRKYVNHIDGDKLNNAINNLEWVTHRENIIHAIENKLKRPSYGESSGKSVLDWAQVLTIHSISKNKMGSTELAKSFKVKQSGLSLIRSGKRWSHFKKLIPSEIELEKERRGWNVVN